MSLVRLRGAIYIFVAAIGHIPRIQASSIPPLLHVRVSQCGCGLEGPRAGRYALAKAIPLGPRGLRH